MQRRTYVLVFMNSFAHFCHDCVWEGRYEKGVKEHQHRSAKQSFWLISSLLVKKGCSSKVEDTDLTSDQHNLMLESWTLIFFVHIWFLPCRSEKPQMPKATSLKQIGSGRIRRPGLISSHQSANFIGLPGKWSGHATSINLCDTYWLEFVEYFLDAFLNLFICQHYVTFKFVFLQQGLSHDTSNSDFQDTSLIHLVPSPARSQRREMWDRWIFPCCSGLRYQELWLWLIWQATFQRIEHI